MNELDRQVAEHMAEYERRVLEDLGLDPDDAEARAFMRRTVRSKLAYDMEKLSITMHLALQQPIRRRLVRLVVWLSSFGQSPRR